MLPFNVHTVQGYLWEFFKFITGGHKDYVFTLFNVVTETMRCTDFQHLFDRSHCRGILSEPLYKYMKMLCELVNHRQLNNCN